MKSRSVMLKNLKVAQSGVVFVSPHNIAVVKYREDEGVVEGESDL